MAVTWRVWICDALTGERLVEPHVAGVSWKAKLNGTGTVSCLIPLPQLGLDAAAWRDYTTPWARVMVVCWGDVPVEAAFITQASWDPAKQQLALDGESLRALLSRRLTFGIGEFHAEPLRVYHLDNRSVAVLAIERGLMGRPRWGLRLRKTYYRAGDVIRVIHPHDFKPVEAIVRDIQDAPAGPDVHFRPVWDEVDGGLAWVPVIGDPRVAGSAWEIVAGVPRSGTIDLKVKWDAKKQATGVFAQGEGSGETVTWGEAGEPASTRYHGPFLDAVVSAKDVSERGVLSGLAASYLSAHQYPTMQVSLSLRADGSPVDGVTVTPTAAQLSVGDTLRVHVPADDYMEDRTIEGYVIGVGSSGNEQLTVEIQ